MSNSIKLSLALIVTPTKEEAKKLDKALSTVDGVFNEICITQAGPHPSSDVEKVIKKHNAKGSFFKWENDFAKARNFNFKQCTGDWIMWIDADDIIRGAENIRKNVELAQERNVTGIATIYNYAHDQHGKVTDKHWKLQIVRNGFYEWKGVIHEDLLPTKDGVDAKIDDVIRVHTANDQDSERSLKRNIKILEDARKKEPGEPRHYFYSARCYLGTEQWEEVIKVINKYLTLSNWKEERYDALNMMGEAYMRLGDYDKAIETHQKAILENEDAPDAYIYKARNYIKLERWLPAFTNLQIAEERNPEANPLKKTALYDHDLYVLSAIALLNLGKFEEAKISASRAYHNRKSEQAKDIYLLADKMAKDEELTKMYRKIGENLIEEPDKLFALLSTVPNELRDDPRLLQMAFSESIEWPDDSIVYYCGTSLEPWDGNSIKNGGIGGSETAVIELSKRWAAAGKQVTVFNRCDAPAGGIVIDGVIYRNFWEFNKADIFNTLVIWRHTALLDHDIKAKQVLIDMHDTVTDGIFTDHRMAKIDKVLVKSEYHKSLYPSVPESKFEVIGNGIDLKRFKNLPKEKEEMRFIYTSCASRGLENLLKAWPEIKEKYPSAELHTFYGWNTFEAAHKNNPVKMEWVANMKEMMGQDGITNHGRVDQKTLAEEMAKSTFWVYPTEFPEIHCITALEMQAANVYPITTGFAALAETQQAGVKIDGDPKTEVWKEKLMNEIDFALDNKDVIEAENEKGQKYLKDCQWDNVAEAWLKVM